MRQDVDKLAQTNRHAKLYQKQLEDFLIGLYTKLFKECSGLDETTKSKPNKYKEGVFQMLNDVKKEKGFDPERDEMLKLSVEELVSLQEKIEATTLSFDEESIFKTAPDLVKMLIKENEVNAKDYIKSLNKLSNDDIELLSYLGQYTLEGIIVYVLSTLFASEGHPAVRAATLLDRLDDCVRKQCSLIKRGQHQKVANCGNIREESMIEKKYRFTFGIGLVGFMMERCLVDFTDKLGGPSAPPEKKGGYYYIARQKYVLCLFDPAILPIKLNLPMVCTPLSWRCVRPHGESPKNLSDLTGGYLSGPSAEFYDRYSLLSSGDINNFHIQFDKDNTIFDNFCNIMNKLQDQPFKIDYYWLFYIQKYRYMFEDSGLLLPEFLARLNMKDVCRILREAHMKDSVINENFSYSDLLDIICKSIQRASYELLILSLADAYNGYRFYLPAFLDFRGRIYRCGILHFHERDLARSLIVFADQQHLFDEKTNQPTNRKVFEEDLKRFMKSTAFHFKSFSTPKEGYTFLIENVLSKIWKHRGEGDVLSQRKIPALNRDLLKLSVDAKRPFQFISNVLLINFGDIGGGQYNVKKFKYMYNTPITQDASASAYQIMSYFLLDEELAKRTNLIPSGDGQIRDVYIYILDELKKFLSKELDPPLSTIVSENLNRKIVKSIFMPIIYGKTLMSSAEELKVVLSKFLSYKECYKVASVCYKFWKIQFSHMASLIELVRTIGWFSSARNSPVYYSIPFFNTVQDYKVKEPIKILVYDPIRKKRSQVTLRVSTSKRDRRKTGTSTFVNFIHQTDAYIAMKVVEKMFYIEIKYKKQDPNSPVYKIPIYTVHDNFVTNISWSTSMAYIYNYVFSGLGPPLLIINKFILMNIIDSDSTTLFDTAQVIPENILRNHLQALKPANLKKKRDDDMWEAKINTILTSYRAYTRQVCRVGHPPEDNQFISHYKRWEEFISSINKDPEEGASEEDFNFSVHY